MDVSLAHAYLCVRDIDVDGAPIVGQQWIVRAEASGWFSLRRVDDERLLLAAWHANAAGGRALFALFGPQSVLEQIAASEPACMPAREAWTRRAEPAVRAFLRRWPIWRFDGFARVGEVIGGAPQAVSGAVRRLIFEGQQIPDPTTTPFPWRFAPDGTIAATDAAAVYRVDAITRPALSMTLAGYALHDELELEEPR